MDKKVGIIFGSHDKGNGIGRNFYKLKKLILLRILALLCLKTKNLGVTDKIFRIKSPNLLYLALERMKNDINQGH